MRPLFPLLLAGLQWLATGTALARTGTPPAVGSSLQFVANGRQWPSQVQYRADLRGGAVFLTRTGLTYSYYSLADLDRIHERKHELGDATGVASEPVHFHAYHVRFDGGNAQAPIVPEEKRSNYYNYFIGNDPDRWSAGMAAYEGVRYQGLYRGVDLHVYSRQTSLKYDFIVSPGASAAQIRLAFDGVTPVITPEGDLAIRTSVNELREQAPYAYQEMNGSRQQVACRYVLTNGVVSFDFPQGYDRSRELVIDPVLIFATYSGSTATTYGWSATYDASGNLYAGGECFSAGWPATTGAFQSAYGGSVDDGINKYRDDGTSLIYSTYYGGANGDYPNTMVVNAAGELVVAGATQSANIATTPGCLDNSFNGNVDFYVAHFNAAGTALIGATYLGGSGNEGNSSIGSGYDANRGEVLTDASGNIFLTAGTTSANFPTTSGAFQTALQGTMDAFVCKLNADCSSLLFSTYLGGSGNDAGLSMVRNSTGELIIGGGTTSTDFPGTGAGWLSASQGGTDGFVAILNSSGTAVTSASYVGTAGNDNVAKVQLDAQDNVYVMGTNSTGLFPVSPGTYSVPNGRVFLAKLSPSVTNRLLSTTIGSTQVQTSPTAFLTDVCGNLYYVGSGAGSGMPLTANAIQSTLGGFWMCVLSQNMAGLSYASYFGAAGDHIDGGSSRLDPQGIVYHSICTSSTTQPTTPSVWCPNKLTSGYDIVSWKFHFQLLGVYASFNAGSTDTFCAPATVIFNNTSNGGQTYHWTFGEGNATSNSASPTYTYTRPGTYRVWLRAYNSGSCAGVDSVLHTIVVRSDTLTARVALTTNDSGCAPYAIAFANTTAGATGHAWEWGDGTPATTTTATPVHTYANPGTYTVRYIASNPALCRNADTAYFRIVVLDPGPHAAFAIAGKDSVCLPATVGVTNNSLSATDYQWDFGDGSGIITSANPPVHAYTAAGTYTIRLYAYNRNYWACIPVDSAEKKIHVFNIAQPLVSVRDTLVCAPDKIFLSAGISNYSPTMNIIWTPANAIFSDPTRAEVLVDATRNQAYMVTVTNTMPGICSVSTAATLQLSLWNKFAGAVDTLICPHDTVRLKTIGDYDSVRWTPALYISDDTARAPQVWPAHGIDYTVYGKYRHCVDTEYYRVSLAPSALATLPDSVLLYPGDSYQINPGGNCLYFSWFPPAGLSATDVANPVAMPEVNTRYYVTAMTELGCRVRDSMAVYVTPDSWIDMPNAFVPGSGPNGRLQPVHLGRVTLRSLQVFDRWGVRVFQTSDINDGWDGTFKGSPQPQGVYIYMVEAVTPAGRRFSKQGNITLIR